MNLTEILKIQKFFDKHKLFSAEIIIDTSLNVSFLKIEVKKYPAQRAWTHEHHKLLFELNNETTFGEFYHFFKMNHQKLLYPIICDHKKQYSVTYLLNLYFSPCGYKIENAGQVVEITGELFDLFKQYGLDNLLHLQGLKTIKNSLV